MNFLDEYKNKDNQGIYCIKNLKNGKVYIGQTNDRFIERYWNHKWKLNNKTHDNKYLQNSWNKYGEDNFEFYVLEVVNNKDIIDEKERFYIKKFSNNYNIQMGGQDSTMLGTKMSESTKKKIGEKNKINGIGRKASEETKLKMSKSRLGKTNWDKCSVTKEQIIQSKNLLMSGMTPIDVSKNMNIRYKIINGLYSNNAYKNAFVEGWEDFYNKTDHSRGIPKNDIDEILKLYENGNSINKISKIIGHCPRTISKYIKRRNVDE